MVWFSEQHKGKAQGQEARRWEAGGGLQRELWVTPKSGKKETKTEMAAAHPGHWGTQRLLGLISLWVGELGSRCTPRALTQSGRGLAGKGAQGCVHKHRAWAPSLL